MRNLSLAGVLRVALPALMFLTRCPTAVHAQSIYGPGGLLLNPTASLPEPGKITPAVLVMPQKLSGGGHETWTSYDVDYGASDRLEAGLTVLSVTPGGNNPSEGGYLKYLVARENAKGMPALAVGGSYEGGGDDNSSSVFLALRETLLSQRCKYPAHLHLGVSYFNQLDGITHNHAEPFAGVDWGLQRKVSLFAEARAALPGQADSSDGDHPARAFGLIWTPSYSYKVVVGFANNGWNANPPTFSIGVGYSIGGGR